MPVLRGVWTITRLPVHASKLINICCVIVATATCFAHEAAAERLRLAASTPLTAYADPLGLDSGNGLIPAIFDGLTTLKSGGILEPALAESWEVKSETTWVFHLRRGVTFHNGTPFTADHVVAQLSFLIEPDSFALPIAVEAETITKVTKIDSHTVRIETRIPDAVLPRKLSRVKIFPLDVWRDMGRTAFSRHPVGTGPYQVLDWNRGGSTGVILAGVDSSWRAPVQIDRVEYIILPDASSRLQSLLAGEVDIANALDPDAVSVAREAGYEVIEQLGPVVMAIAFHNCGDGPSPMKDIRVRRALATSVDKKRIVDQLLGGITTVSTQGGTPGAFGYNPDIQDYPYDPEAAKQLLADAGYADGLDIVVVVFSGQFPADSLIFQQIAQEWAAIGVNAELRRLAFPEYNRRALVADWDGIDAISVPWSHYQYGEVSRALKRFAGLHAGPYFCAPDLQAEITIAETEMNETRRETMLQDLMARLHDQVPSIPLVQWVSINGLSERIVEFKSNTGEILFGEMRVLGDSD